MTSKPGNNFRSYRLLGLLGGFALGLGAPAGCLLLAIILRGQPVGLDWILAEIHGYAFFYSYMTLATPVAFMILGAYLGSLVDRIHNQNLSLKKLMETIQHQSAIDEATGVFNRRHLFGEIEKEIIRSGRYGHTLSGVMIDLDFFKEINDQYGHPVGDRLLREIAGIILKSVRHIDTVGRYGGDEFFVLMPESNVEGTRIAAERILHNIHQCRLKDHLSLPLASASIGTATFTDIRGLHPNEFIAAADQALLKAKAEGKNRIHSGF